MKTLLSTMALVTLLLTCATGCPINHWSARQELEEQGYHEIYFGEMPNEPDQHPFFARRAGQVCSGIVTFPDSGDAQIQSQCRAPGGSGGH